MSEQSPSAFWDQRYQHRGEAFGRKPNVYLASRAALFRPGMRVLVPGDGEGRNGVWLAEQGLVVDTLDASPIGVSNARALAAERGVSINAAVGDLTTWPWPDAAYDAIISIFLHFNDAIRARMHAAMIRALNPGGFILIEGYAPGQLAHQKAGSVGGPQTLDHLLSADKLRADFGTATIEELVEAEVLLDEGVRHRGLSSVVRLIARRSD